MLEINCSCDVLFICNYTVKCSWQVNSYVIYHWNFDTNWLKGNDVLLRKCVLGMKSLLWFTIHLLVQADQVKHIVEILVNHLLLRAVWSGSALFASVSLAIMYWQSKIVSQGLLKRKDWCTCLGMKWRNDFSVFA